jgi:hypothetical protein
MLFCKKLATFALLVAVLAPLQAATKKGDKLLAMGRAAEIRKQFDAALQLFEQALSEDPGDSGYAFRPGKLMSSEG